MRRWLIIAAFGVALLPLPASGQRRGAMSGGFSGRSGFAARGPSFGASRFSGPGFNGSRFFGPSFNRGFGPGVRFRTGFRGPFGFPPFRHRRFLGLAPWEFYGYAAYPAYPYPYPTEPYVAPYPGYYANPQYDRDQELSQQVDRLSDEVERLRQQRESRPADSQPSTPAESTDLVFLDKHVQHVQNYAIIGQTLWVFSEQRATKIPLAQLDLPATVRLNDQHGIDFRLPN